MATVIYGRRAYEQTLFYVDDSKFKSTQVVRGFRILIVCRRLSGVKLILCCSNRSIGNLFSGSGEELTRAWSTKGEALASAYNGCFLWCLDKLNAKS